jgi:hypothetical protein
MIRTLDGQRISMEGKAGVGWTVDVDTGASAGLASGVDCRCEHGNPYQRSGHPLVCSAPLLRFPLAMISQPTYNRGEQHCQSSWG